MRRAVLWGALAVLAVWGLTRPSLKRGVEFSAGDYDTNSDCIVRGDDLVYHTPANLIDGILGGHRRGYEVLPFNRKAYRVVFARNADEIEVVRVRDCNVHLRGEAFAVDGNSVDTVVTSKRGRLVVDRVPNRGYGPAREIVVDASWDRKYRIRASDADLDTFDLAVPLADAGVLVARGLEEMGQGVTYDAYDYFNARRLRFVIPEAVLPYELDRPVRIKKDEQVGLAAGQ